MMTIFLASSRAKRLKALTHATHERVDNSIMAASSFADLEGYARFLSVQYLLHQHLAVLYQAPSLQALLPGLAGRQRLALIEADLADLALELPAPLVPALFTTEPLDVATALGWLYVVEGSNLGAALLRKEAAKIGLSDDFGARHLAPSPDGPAAHWRAFTAALDAVALDEADEPRVGDGANAAFACVQSLIDHHMG